MYTSDLF